MVLSQQDQPRTRQNGTVRRSAISQSLPFQALLSRALGKTVFGFSISGDRYRYDRMCWHAPSIIMCLGSSDCISQ